MVHFYDLWARPRPLLRRWRSAIETCTPIETNMTVSSSDMLVLRERERENLQLLVGKSQYTSVVHLENQDFFNPIENCCPPAQFWKNHCHCILEGHLSTNPMLSALHLQGPKSNIYVHFHWVNKQLIGISSSKWNHQ